MRIGVLFGSILLVFAPAAVSAAENQTAVTTVHATDPDNQPVTPVAYSIFDDLGFTAALRIPLTRLRWLRERFGRAKVDTRHEPSLAPTVQVGQPHSHLAEQVETRRD